MNIREIAYAEKAKRRRANTVEGYRSALRLHVIPRWGDCEIQDIDPDELQDWVDSFELPGAAEKAYKTLRQVIRWAIRKFRLRVWDPTQGIELPRKPAHEVQPLEAHEVKETLRAFWGHADEPTLLLSSCLGLRPGEAYALSWSDVDMRSGAVKVHSTLQEVGGLLYRYATKTPKSDRTIYPPLLRSGSAQGDLARSRKAQGSHHRRPQALAGCEVDKAALLKIGRALRAHVPQAAHLGDARHRGGRDA